MPWNIYNNPVAINYFLGSLGALLGPLFGIIIADYFLIKQRRVEVEDLYRWGEGSRYWYQGGINHRAIWAFVPAAIVSVIIALVPVFGSLAPFSWFIGAGLAGVLYWVLMARGSSEPVPEERRG
jgi:nucleobase:cation symporter-1, NCS1 family